MQKVTIEPFDDEVEKDYQDYIEGVRRGDVFGATGPDADDSGGLIVTELLYELRGTSPISDQYRRFLSFALRAMLEGEDARKSFGLNSPQGRKKSYELSRRVKAFIEEQVNNGLTKNKAIQAASAHFFKDPRHIQRLLSE